MLGRIGPLPSAAGSGLIASLNDVDETVRWEAAEALGKVGGDTAATVNALVQLLPDASASLSFCGAALGTMKKAAAAAVATLVPLLQDRDESVRTAVAEAIGQIGRLNGQDTENLVEGLSSPDNMIRADGGGPGNHRHFGEEGCPVAGRDGDGPQ